MAKTYPTVNSPYGFIYDKSEGFCSEIEYNKAMRKAIMANGQVKRLPIYKNFFSEVRRYPNSKIRSSYKNIIPPWYVKNFEEFSKEINSYISRYSGEGCDSKTFENLIPERFKVTADPVGGDRYKYITAAQSTPGNILAPDVEMANQYLKRGYYQQIAYIAPSTKRSIGVQTMYRDSSAQTDPYSPDFVMRPGAEPELLNLIPLSYRNGLPPGYHEVLVLERTRRCRQWKEKNTGDPKSIHDARKRQYYLSKWETEEWKIREEQIEELQLARLKVMIELIQERKQYLTKMHDESVRRFYLDKIKDRELKVDKIRYNYIKELRRVIKKRAKIQVNYKKPSIIEAYGDPASQVWAPLTRLGQFLDRGSQRYVVKNSYLTDYDGLVDLEKGLPSFVLNPNLKIPKIEMYTKDGFKKKRYRWEDELDELYKYLTTKEEAARLEKERPLKFLQTIIKVTTRLPTPNLDENEDHEIDIDIMTTLLQKLIRGRNIQVMMYEGKEKHKDLIRELRSTHAIERAEIEIKSHERALVLALQRSRLNEEHKIETMEEVFNTLKGINLGDTFDYLTKELIRLQEERRIHALIMMAIRERRIREAEESGLRQLEERRRREEDEIFKQIIKMHQTTVDSYLENLVAQNIEWSAEDVSRFEVVQLAEKINEKAYDQELTLDYLQTEEIVSDLVHHFLIPEVYKKDEREKIAKKQQKYLLAAHKEIVKSVDITVDPEKRLAFNRFDIGIETDIYGIGSDPVHDSEIIEDINDNSSQKTNESDISDVTVVKDEDEKNLD